METREIKDSQGRVVISITLPENTPESRWQEVISGYVIEENTNSEMEDNQE
jgi:hypothetical protein